MRSTKAIGILGSLVLGIAVLGCAAESDDFDRPDAVEPSDSRTDGGAGADADASLDVTPPSETVPGADADADAAVEPEAEAPADTADTPPPPPCGDGVCRVGVETCGTCAADCCPCPVVETLVDCPLTDGSVCGAERGGGTLGAAGWVSGGWDSRLVYDLGMRVHCGAVRFHIGPFNPMTQYVHHGGEDRYCDFLGVFQGDSGNHWTAARNRECWIDFQASDEEPDTFRDHKIKMKPHAGTGDGFGGGETKYTSHEINWTVPHDLCVEWNGEQALFFIDGRQEIASNWTWGTDGATGPGLRYVFIGRGGDTAGGWLDGATYSNVQAVAGGTCR